MQKISVIGLGKLGSPLLYFLASKKIICYGFDLNKKILNILKKKRSPFKEENLQNYINKYSKYVRICDTLEEAVINTDITFIILPTPSDEKGLFINKFITEALLKIKSILKNKKKFHLINITSTVMPESCNNVFKKIFKKNKNIGLCYNPHFIALGSVISNMENPDLLLIGSDNLESQKKINTLYKYVYKKKTNFDFIQNLNLYESEIAKMAVNSFVTMKISFSNFISNISQKSQLKSKAVNILNAIGMDTRIGKKYLGVGTKFSGPCFPRDNIALSQYCKKLKSSHFLLTATDNENNLQVNRYVNKLEDVIRDNKIKKPNIGILGLSYKSNTDVTELSPGLELLHKLKKKYKTTFYDPYIKNNFELLKYQINDFNNFLKNNDIFFLCYKDKYFNIKNKINKKIYIIDLWNFYPSKISKNIKLFSLDN
jgi:UDPglucose 6-dehydrogenase